MLAEPEATKPLLQRLVEVSTLLATSPCGRQAAQPWQQLPNSKLLRVRQKPPTNQGFYIPSLEFLPFCGLTHTMCSVLNRHWAVQQGLASPVFHFPPDPRRGCPSRSLSSALLGAADAAETLAPPAFGCPPCKTPNMSFPHGPWAPLARSPSALNCPSDSINPAEFHQPIAPTSSHGSLGFLVPPRPKEHHLPSLKLAAQGTRWEGLLQTPKHVSGKAAAFCKAPGFPVHQWRPRRSTSSTAMVLFLLYS